MWVLVIWLAATEAPPVPIEGTYKTEQRCNAAGEVWKDVAGSLGRHTCLPTNLYFMKQEHDSQ